MAIKEVMNYGVTEIKLPKYIREILENVVTTPMPYRFILRGVNQYRPDYGIYADMEKLIKWAERNYAECKVVRYNTERNDYYAYFEMTDPTAYILEEIEKGR